MTLKKKHIYIFFLFIFRWIYNGTLPFNSARKHLPNNIKLHLGNRLSKFEPKVYFLILNLSREVLQIVKTIILKNLKFFIDFS